MGRARDNDILSLCLTVKLTFANNCNQIVTLCKCWRAAASTCTPTVSSLLLHHHLHLRFEWSAALVNQRHNFTLPQSFWTMMADAPPPPLQALAAPYSPGFRLMASVFTMRVPDILRQDKERKIVPQYRCERTATATEPAMRPAL